MRTTRAELEIKRHASAARISGAPLESRGSLCWASEPSSWTRAGVEARVEVEAEAEAACTGNST